jgi:hypothetical protein
LRCGGASPPAATYSTENHVAHRRIKIERVYRPYLTATEAADATNNRYRVQLTCALQEPSQVYISATIIYVYLRLEIETATR